MNRYFYAQLNELNVVCGLSDLSGEVVAQNMIPLTSLSAAKLGDIYQNGAFITPEPEPSP